MNEDELRKVLIFLISYNDRTLPYDLETWR